MVIKQPDDKTHFILPDLGEGVHEAEIVRWCVSPGDQVKEHQTLAEMETDKALVEVPSPWSGVIRELHGKEGDIVNVGNTLVSYVTQTKPAARDAEGTEPADLVESDDAGTVVGTVDSTLTMPASFSRQIPTDPQGDEEKAQATPAVRRIARELEIDINSISGTGRGGRVTAGDVHEHAIVAGPFHATPRKDTDSATPLATPVSMPLEGVAQRIPFKGVRRKIAQSLLHSIQTAVHYTVVEEADVTELEKRRSGLEALLGRSLSLLPFIMTAVCKGLQQHPMLNAIVDDFVEEIRVMKRVNLGCAVDTDHGLMVPVIDKADLLTVVQLSDRIAELASGCRDRTIEREHLIGGTFTISNVGSAGGAFATPIINYPEVAILATGRTRERVLTKDGTFYAGSVLPLSLSCDHRVVDGAEGARFLQTVTDLLQNPSELLPEA